MGGGIKRSQTAAGLLMLFSKRIRVGVGAAPPPPFFFKILGHSPKHLSIEAPLQGGLKDFCLIELDGWLRFTPKYCVETCGYCSGPLSGI